MAETQLTFVTFEPVHSGFVAYVPLSDFLKTHGHQEETLRRAARVYATGVASLRTRLRKIEERRRRGQRITARMVWDVGERIFTLVEQIGRLSLQINGLYAHLVRDLGVKKEWLEKVIIFRHHIPDKRSIPRGLSWGLCARRPKSAAQLILQGSLNS